MYFRFLSAKSAAPSPAPVFLARLFTGFTGRPRASRKPDRLPPLLPATSHTIWFFDLFPGFTPTRQSPARPRHRSRTRIRTPFLTPLLAVINLLWRAGVNGSLRNDSQQPQQHSSNRNHRRKAEDTPRADHQKRSRRPRGEHRSRAASLSGEAHRQDAVISSGGDDPELVSAQDGSVREQSSEAEAQRKPVQSASRKSRMIRLRSVSEGIRWRFAARGTGGTQAECAAGEVGGRQDGGGHGTLGGGR